LTERKSVTAEVSKGAEVKAVLAVQRQLLILSHSP
jgi:hypothetical protein